MPNIYSELRALLDPGKLQIGEVTGWQDGLAKVSLHGAGEIYARGHASVGDKVYVQAGVIQGPAPNLPVYVDVI